jgi:hypothetical protein
MDCGWRKFESADRSTSRVCVHEEVAPEECQTKPEPHLGIRFAAFSSNYEEFWLEVLSFEHEETFPAQVDSGSQECGCIMLRNQDVTIDDELSLYRKSCHWKFKLMFLLHLQRACLEPMTFS